nr:hypothetical protein [Tanacetum cinerariifolium]
GEELAKKIHAEQEAEFARQQEELAQKVHAKRVASPTEHGTGMSDQRRQELDVAQLIYTEADWLELLAKIATNSALSKKLLGDDVTEENMNKRAGYAPSAQETRVSCAVQDIDLEALHTLARTSLGGDSSDTPAGHDAAEVPADTSMPSHNPSTIRRRLRKPFSSSASAHVSENIPGSASVPAIATIIPAGSFVDAAVRAAAAP